MLYPGTQRIDAGFARNFPYQTESWYTCLHVKESKLKERQYTTKPKGKQAHSKHIHECLWGFKADLWQRWKKQENHPDSATPQTTKNKHQRYSTSIFSCIQSRLQSSRKQSGLSSLWMRRIGRHCLQHDLKYSLPQRPAWKTFVGHSCVIPSTYLLLFYHAHLDCSPLSLATIFLNSTDPLLQIQSCPWLLIPAGYCCGWSETPTSQNARSSPKSR